MTNGLQKRFGPARVFADDELWAQLSRDRSLDQLINVAALRMQQFGVQFYQASLTAQDIDKLVRFEVLSYGEKGGGVRGAAMLWPL